jgi:hypothetical protein
LVALTPLSASTTLRAIAAILRAAAGLDREQRGKLHLVARMMARCTVWASYIRSIERQIEQRGNFLAGPVGADGGCSHRQFLTQSFARDRRQSP